MNMDIKKGVNNAYSAAADNPEVKHPFPVGRSFAESLGYPSDLLDSLPSAAVNAFAGVSNVSVFAKIPLSSVVLDLGCGAGLDTLIAAEKTGPEGSVTGIDFSESMLSRARTSVKEKELQNVSFYVTEAESIPVANSTIDVAIVNGIFNLNPAREAIILELARVLKKGGSLYGAELLLLDNNDPKKQPTQCSIKDWFA